MSMIEPTDIEKKSLEAHVELCAERYNALEFKIANVEEKLNKVDETVGKVYNSVQRLEEKQNDRALQVSFSAVAMLLGIVGWLLATYVLK